MKKKLNLLFFLYFILSIKFCLAQAPVFDWAGVFSGNYWSSGTRIALDPAGNVFVGGEFGGTVDFNPGIAIDTLTSGGGSASTGVLDIFVCKLNASGAYQWAKRLGGYGSDDLYAMVTDVSGNCYLGGELFTNGGMFCKLDALGNTVFYFNNYGNAVYSLVTDANANLYITGKPNQNMDYDPGPTTYTISNPGNTFFITKLDPGGNFLWAKSFECPSGGATGYSITLDADENIYIAGSFSGSVDFDSDTSSFIINASLPSGFVCKLDETGAFVWAKNFSGSAGYSACNMASITHDVNCNVYCAGFFRDSVDFDAGTGMSIISTTPNNSPDAFILKIDSSGNFNWVKKIGGGSYSYLNSGSIDASGNFIGIGYFADTIDADPGPGISNFVSAGNTDAFILQLNSAGDFIYAGQLGGTGGDLGLSISCDSSGAIWCTGYFQDTVDFDPGTNTHFLSTSGAYSYTLNAYVLKMNLLAGVEESLPHKDFNVFPNPAITQISVFSLLKGEISIYNAIGEKILQTEVRDGKTEINISNFSSGIYFMRISSKENTVIKKFVKTTL